MQDLAEFRDWIVQVDGQFRDDRLRTYLAYEDHWLFLIRSHDEIAGFALVRKSKPETYVIGEFFIVQRFRRTGVGSIAVFQILQKFIGHWEIPFQIDNQKAAAFWRGTISKLGYTVTEIELPVAENPDLPPDTWLRFTS